MNRGWIWFFVILALLTATAIIIQLNTRQQLTPERLAEARQAWKEKGPRDYDLEYVQSTIGNKDTYQVEVRGGKAATSLCNGQLEKERLFRERDMSALFRFISQFMEKDAQPGAPRVYVTAVFDSSDGHVLHYTRSVMSKRERQEITVTKFKPIQDEESKADKSRTTP